MKNPLRYIILIFAAACLFFLVGLTGNKKYDTRITFSKTSKQPYGAYVFYQSLKAFFPEARFINNNRNTFFYDEDNHHLQNKLYIQLQSLYLPQGIDTDELLRFANNGNNVFISAFSIPRGFYKLLGEDADSKFDFKMDNEMAEADTMTSTLSTEKFGGNSSYTYPGKKLESYFRNTDSIKARVIGYGVDGKPNFIHIKIGKGNLYYHLSPLSFSNYFLLYANNINYFEKIFSQFLKNTPVVIWDEYTRNTNGAKGEKDWLGALLKDPNLRTGILIAMLFILIFALTEMRRKQRIIPILPKPVNDSMDFVKTVGLLYYEKGDHTNLAQKISTYFLEHVRSRYKLFAKTHEPAFVKELSYKSGVNERLVDEIVRQINQIENGESFTETELIILQKNIENFYNY